MTDLERAVDAEVQKRLATDRAYRNAENADEQADREREIEEQVVREAAQAAIRAADRKLRRELEQITDPRLRAECLKTMEDER